jgi:hypothetical protein
MGKLLFSLVVIAVIWVLLAKLGVVAAPPLPGTGAVFAGDSGVREDGEMVFVRDDHFEGRYRVTGDLSGDFMVFGGGAMGDQATGHSVVSLMAKSDVRSIAAIYPDFDKCKSDGAPEAKAAMRGYTFFGADAATRRMLQDLPGASLNEIRKNRAHICAHIDGSTLSLVDMKMIDSGEDVTSKLPALIQRVEFALAREAEQIDCAQVLP